MGSFNASILTDKGNNLIAKAVAGLCEIKFTRIALSDTQILGGASSVTDIGEIKQSGKVSEVILNEDRTVTVRTVFMNVNLEKGYYIRTIGLFAQDPDEGEILYSVATANEVTATADWMPAYTASMDSITRFDITMATVISDKAIVNLDIDPTAMVTVAQFTELRNTMILSKNMQVYVDSTTGNDTYGDGSSEKPYKTIQKAVDVCSMGMCGYAYSIWVTDGVYDEDVIIGDRVGTLILEGESVENTVVSSITCRNISHVRISNVKFTGRYDMYSNVGIDVQTSSVYLQNCAFRDCVARANNGGEIHIHMCDFSNYRSGSVNYGTIHANGGLIRCYEVSGTNNKGGYGGGISSAFGGDVYVVTNCTLEADVLILEDFGGKVRYNSGRYSLIGSVKGGAGGVDISSVSNIFTEYLVVQRFEDKALFYTIIPTLLTSSSLQIDGGGSTIDNYGLFGRVWATTGAISQSMFYVGSTDNTANTTLYVYGRRT